jgi:ABC-type sugar transport system substrate-binding protein
MSGVKLWRAIAIAMALGVSSSAVAQTEPISLLCTADPIALSAPSSELQSTPHRTKGITFNEYGDLKVRYRDVTMTMAYNPSEDIQSSQANLRAAQKQDIPAISGIILRVSMGF